MTTREGQQRIGEDSREWVPDQGTRTWTGQGGQGRHSPEIADRTAPLIYSSSGSRRMC